MNAESITLSIEVLDPVVTARTVEVRCGRSFVTIRQVMGRTDEEWTVYEGDSFDQGRNKGLQGKVRDAPTYALAEDLIGWATELVTRRERTNLATAALQKHVGDHASTGETGEDEA